MQTIGTQASYFLSGGGNEKQSFPLDKFFFEQLPQKSAFLYIPIALRGHRLFETAPVWMQGVINLHKRNDIHFETWNSFEGRTSEDLKQFSAVYLGGGNTWLLMKEVRESGFHSLLKNFLEEGGVLYGGSAGAIILGRRIDTHDDPNTVKWNNNEGLSFFGTLSVVCHCASGQSARLKMWAKTHQLPILCLSENTGCIIHLDGSGVCIGEIPAVIYLPNGKMITVQPGESFSRM